MEILSFKVSLTCCKETQVSLHYQPHVQAMKMKEALRYSRMQVSLKNKMERAEGLAFHQVYTS